MLNIILVLFILLLLQIRLKIEFKRLEKNTDKLNTHLDEMIEISKLTTDAQKRTSEILLRILKENK